MDKVQKRKKITAGAKFLLLIGIVFLLPLYIAVFHRDILNSFSSVEDIEYFFSNNKIIVALAYILFQSLQIIICIIPGQGLQMGAGYFYGVPGGLVLSIIGAFAGSVITYYLARILGHDWIHIFFGEEKIKKMIQRFNSKKATIIVFLIFLIPGIPKDLCNYAAGLSEMKLKPFLVISLIGRTPGMLGSIIIGRQLYYRSYAIAVTVGITALIFFVLGIIYHKRINSYLDSLYDKYIGDENEQK